LEQGNAPRAALLASFFAGLAAVDIDYCVLRNFTELFGEAFHDIDMLANPTRFRGIKRAFADACREEGFYFYFSVVKGKSLFLKAVPPEWSSAGATDEVVRVHIVGFVSLHLTSREASVRGLATRVFLEEVSTTSHETGSLRVIIPTALWHFVFLAARMLVRPKDKYKKMCLALLDDASLCEDIEVGAGQGSVAEFTSFLQSGTAVPRAREILRQLYRSSACRHPLADLAQMIILAGLNVREAFMQKGLIIAFSGPDGAGKTVTSQRLIHALHAHLGCKVKNVKCLAPITARRPAVGKRIRARMRGIDVTDGIAMERDRGKGLSWTARRFVGLLFLLMQYPAGYLFARMSTLRAATVVVDTSCFDDFVKRHRPEFRTLQRVVTPLLRPGDLWLLLVGEPEIIVSRKPELTIEEVREYYERMGRISAATRVKPVMVRSDRGIESAVDTVVGASLAKLAELHSR